MAKLTAQEQALIESTTATVVQHLRMERSHDSAMRLVRKVELTLDREIGELQRTRPEKAACKPGCDHCCYRVRFADALEVSAVADFVRKNFDKAARAELDKRIDIYKKAVSPVPGRDLLKVRTACPLLVNGLCSAYESRPLLCTGTNSLDAGSCERDKLHPEEQVLIPEVPGQTRLYLSARTGVRRALNMAAIPNWELDFGRALAIALEAPEAAYDHLHHSQIFAPAIPMVEQPMKTPNVEARFKRYGPGEEPYGDMDTMPLHKHFALALRNETEAALKELNFDHPIALIRHMILPSLYRSEEEIDLWRGRFSGAIDELGRANYDPREAFDALPSLETFRLPYHMRNDREILSRLGDVLVSRIAQRVLPDLCLPIDPRPRQGKLKVGYIGGNLNMNNGGNWSLGWLKNHGEDIETHAIYLRGLRDSTTLKFQQAADHFYQFVGDVPKNARLIKSLGLDVLIYPEIGLGRENFPYAVLRLAPVQCTAWGHPDTSGLPTIDYYLSSELMEPVNGQDAYREQLIRLPGSGLCYPRSEIPIGKMQKSDFGLDEGPLLLSCQNPIKLHPRWDHLYAEICERTGRPIVFLEGLFIDVSLIKERMAKAGVNAIWMPRLNMSEFKSLLAIADVNIDTPGWNGGNTTVEALTAGTPVVSFPGEFMRGRHGLAFLTLAGVPGLVAQSEEGFVDLACDFARQRAAMSDLDADWLYDDLKPVAALDEFIRGSAA